MCVLMLRLATIKMEKNQTVEGENEDRRYPHFARWCLLPASSVDRSPLFRLELVRRLHVGDCIVEARKLESAHAARAGAIWMEGTHHLEPMPTPDRQPLVQVFDLPAGCKLHLVVLVDKRTKWLGQFHHLGWASTSAGLPRW